MRTVSTGRMFQSPRMIRRIWKRLKAWRQVRLGPVALVFKLERAVRITSGIHRHHRLHRHDARETLPDAAARAPRVKTAAPAAGRTKGREVAVVVGVGPGFGYALARALAGEGFDLVLVSRDANRLSGLVAELHAMGCAVSSFGADATDEVSVARLFDTVCARHGTPSLVVYSLQYSGPGETVEIELPAFELSWRHNCLGAFLVARRAAQLMTPLGQGSIVLVGSTSSVLGRAGHLNLAVGKFGQRALAQVMARELWPLGIHVAHAIIDADIAEDAPVLPTSTQADPAAIAASVLAIHRQPRSAWTSELDLRPWNEKFWEHC